MDRIRFACSNCETKLGVHPDMADKAIACPKCRTRNVVPAPATAKAAPPEKEEPAATIRFSCTKCGSKLKVLSQFAGRAIPCPHCKQNTIAPDMDEVGSYGLGGDTQSDSDDLPAGEDRPLDEWLPDADELNLPLTWRTKLATARTYTEDERWTKALGLLNELFQKELHSKGKIGTHILRKPLAYCLGRWAAREIDRIDDEGVKLSKPVRIVLKKAGDMKRWGGSLASSECPLCLRQLIHFVGTTQIRTTAGSAYVCCAKPTAADNELVRRVDKINKKLILATSLDPDNRQVPAALKLLPVWYRAVDIYGSTWTRPVMDDDIGKYATGGDDGNTFAASLAGNVIGEVLSNLLG